MSKFDQFMQQTRTLEVINASIARHKKDIETTKTTPLELKAAFLAAFYLQCTMLEKIDPCTKDLGMQLLQLAKTLCPELMVQNVPVFERALKNVMGDVEDLLVLRQFGKF